jgi:pimeloyl-ACP methyl ester carboxylesterase
MPAIETWRLRLPHGIELACRCAGQRGRPVMVFLHGFPEAAFVWDALLRHFSQPENGGYFCVAPNLRGYAGSSAPVEVDAYHPRQLVQDISALTRSLSSEPLAALVAHDWGGALAWNLAAQEPELLQRLVILNAPHPATFARELAHSPAQQAASAYMQFLARPDAAQRLAEEDFRRLWALFDGMGASQGPRAWLDDTLRAQYRQTWLAGLYGPCAYYAATALKPPSGTAARQVPRDASALGRVGLPTMLIWGLRDTALLPGLLDDLHQWVPALELHRVEDATHWIVHEQPDRVMALIASFLQRSPPQAGA